MVQKSLSRITNILVLILIPVSLFNSLTGDKFYPIVRIAIDVAIIILMIITMLTDTNSINPFSTKHTDKERVYLSIFFIIVSFLFFYITPNWLSIFGILGIVIFGYNIYAIKHQ